MNQEQQKGAAIIVGVVAAIFCYVYFLYMPLSAQISGLENELSKKQQELDDAKIKVKQVEVLKAQNIDPERDLNFTRKRLTKTDDQPGIIKEISRVAAEKNISVMSLEFQKPVANAKGFFSEMPIKLSLICDYTDLGQFLTRLGYSTRLINCADCQFSASADQRGSLNVTAILKAFVLTADLASADNISKAEVNERAIEPLYRYTQDSAKDPFKSLSGNELQQVASELNIMSLRLESVIVLSKTKLAVLVDGSNVPYYLIGSKLYNKDKTDIIKNVEGSYDGGRVELKQTDPVSGSIKQRLFEMPRSR